MIVTIHQPEHLPWLGFFNKISKADIFVILDNVQFRKNYYQNRNRIMGTNGEQWICIPTVTKGHIDCDLAHTLIDLNGVNTKWREKYLRTIQMSYGKYPFYDEVYPVLEDSILTDSEFLCDINIAIIKSFSEKLRINPRFIRASEMSVSGKKSDLILDICKELKATTYISGPSGRDYLDRESFVDNGILVRYNDYKSSAYRQLKSKEFVPNLAALDLVMNCGWKEGRRIMMENNELTSIE